MTQNRLNRILVLMIAAVCALPLLGQDPTHDDVPLTNWAVPSTTMTGRLRVAGNALPSPASTFIAIRPYRASVILMFRAR